MPAVAFNVQELRAEGGLSTTVIRIKRSQNSGPSNLANGEMAYAFGSNKLFIGQTNAASDAITVEYIGGKLLVDKVANLESIILGGSADLTLGSLTFGNNPVGTNNAVMFTKADGVVEFVGGTSGQLLQIAANGTPVFDELDGGAYS